VGKKKRGGCPGVKLKGAKKAGGQGRGKTKKEEIWSARVS